MFRTFVLTVCVSLGPTLACLPFAKAEGASNEIDARKLTPEEKHRIVDEAKDPKLRTLREETALLLDIYAVDYFIHKTKEGRHNAHVIETAISKDPMLFPERLIREFEQWEKSNPLRLAAAAQILGNFSRKVDEKARERLWRMVPPLRKNKSALVRRAALTLVFFNQKSKDICPLFVESLDDMAIPEGDKVPVALHAVLGISVSKKCSPEAVSKLVKLLDSPIKDLSAITAAELPLIVKEDVKLRKAVADIYADRMNRGDGPLYSMLARFPELQPEPGHAAHLLISVYERDDVNVASKELAIQILGRIETTQPFAEDFLAGQLNVKDRVLQNAVIETLGRYRTLRPATISALTKTRDKSRDAGFRFRVDELLRKLK